MCSHIEEKGIFLNRIQINQLNLIKIGQKETKLYGIVNTYSGIKMKINSPKCFDYTYIIPDGYIYELPEIFSSAWLVSMNSKSGIPQRQGIIHYDLFYKHAIVSYDNILYGLTDELFHLSGIPELMSKHPRCEILNKTRLINKVYNINSTLRPLIYPSLTNTQFDNSIDSNLSTLLTPYIHPSLIDDHQDISELSILPPLKIRVKTSLKCYYCLKSSQKLDSLMIYCPLCRKRCVQSPHIYCTKQCQLLHRQEHYKYHESKQSEQQINDPIYFISYLPRVKPSNDPKKLSPQGSIIQENQTKIIEFKRNLINNENDNNNNINNNPFYDSSNSILDNNSNDKDNDNYDKDKDNFQLLKDRYDSIVSKTESEFRQDFYGIQLDRIEVWILGFLCFYLVCWYILRSGEISDNDIEGHDEM